MILTGKAKRAFIDHHWQSKFKEEDYKEYENYLDKAELNHLYSDIIEWFDSVGIYITTRILKCDVYPFGFVINDNIYAGIQNKFETRQEATARAIEKANEIYNETR